MGPDDAYGRYYRQVELHWSLARGNQVIVSPLEFEQIESWFQSGVPLPVVERAIDLFIERKRKNKRKRPFLLNHVEGTVEKCHREYVSLHEGEGEERDLVAAKLKQLVKKVAAVAESYPDARDLIESMVAELQRLDVAAIVHYEDVENRFREMETSMTAWFLENMGEDRREAIVSDVTDLLTEAEEPDLYRKMINDAVRVIYRLPRLTLLG